VHVVEIDLGMEEHDEVAQLRRVQRKARHAAIGAAHSYDGAKQVAVLIVAYHRRPYEIGSAASCSILAVTRRARARERLTAALDDFGLLRLVLSPRARVGSRRAFWRRVLRLEYSYSCENDENRESEFLQ